MAVRGSCCFVSSCKISHFGRKPVMGGSPPSESSNKGAEATIKGDFVQAIARELMLVVSLNFRVKKAEDVISR